jgi:hypothetical protein
MATTVVSTAGTTNIHQRGLSIGNLRGSGEGTLVIYAVETDLVAGLRRAKAVRAGVNPDLV